MWTPIKTARQTAKPVFSSPNYLESSLAFCDLCFALIDGGSELYFICRECEGFAACLTCMKNKANQLTSHAHDHLFCADKPYPNTHWIHRNLSITCNVCNQKNFPGRRYQCRQCSDYNVCSNCLTNAKRTHCVRENHIFDFIPNPTRLHSNRNILAQRAIQVLRHRSADSFDRDQITGWTMDEAMIIADQAWNIYSAARREASEIFKDEDFDSPPSIIEHDKLIPPLVTIACH